MTGAVLIVTRSTFDRSDLLGVMQALIAAEARVFCFDTDCFPTQTDLTVRCGGRRGMSLGAGGHELDLDAITSIWFHKFRPGEQLPRNMDRDYREISAEASRTTVLGA